MSRTFGVEIEAYGINPVALSEAILADGIDCTVESYNHRTRNHWKITTDASVQGTNAFEIVSPVLSGTQGVEQVERVCEIITQLGGKVNKSCGVHVHIGGSDLTLKQLKMIAKAWLRYERVVDSFMPPSRRANNNEYCQSNRSPFTTEALAFEAIDRCETIDHLIQTVSNGTRYKKLNLQAYWRHQTIEFRHHSGSTDATKICNWIRFCLEFIDIFKDARVTAKQTNGGWYRIATQFFQRITRRGTTNFDLRGFYRARQKHFGITTQNFNWAW